MLRRPPGACEPRRCARRSGYAYDLVPASTRGYVPDPSGITAFHAPLARDDIRRRWEEWKAAAGRCWASVPREGLNESRCPKASRFSGVGYS